MQGGSDVILGFAVIATCLTNPPIERWSPLPNSISFLSLQSENFSFGLLGMEHGEGRRGKGEGGKSKEEEKLLR